MPGFGTGPDLLLSLMATEVGLDPKKDLRWIAERIEARSPPAATSAGNMGDVIGTSWFMDSPSPAAEHRRYAGGDWPA